MTLGLLTLLSLILAPCLARRADVIFVLDNCLCGDLEANCTNHSLPGNLDATFALMQELHTHAAATDHLDFHSHVFGIRHAAAHHIGMDVPLASALRDEILARAAFARNQPHVEQCKRAPSSYGLLVATETALNAVLRDPRASDIHVVLALDTSTHHRKKRNTLAEREDPDIQEKIAAVMKHVNARVVALTVIEHGTARPRDWLGQANFSVAYRDNSHFSAAMTRKNIAAARGTHLSSLQYLMLSAGVACRVVDARFMSSSQLAADIISRTLLPTMPQLDPPTAYFGVDM